MKRHRDIQSTEVPSTHSELGAEAARQSPPGYDCIIVLGGGVPLGPRKQLPFVANRCEAARRVWASAPDSCKPKILCLSAGTAHCPQLMCANGLPIWEATVSAAVLIDSGVPSEDVVVETTSYDTIGNARCQRALHFGVHVSGCNLFGPRSTSRVRDTRTLRGGAGCW